MIYDSAGRLSAFLRCPQELRNEWKWKSLAGIAQQAMRTDAFLELYRSMEERGISALVIKGLICRRMFAKPDLRISSDEDILIQPQNQEKCWEFLREQGFQCWDGEPDGYESAWLNQENQLYLEVHTSLMPADAKPFCLLNDEFTQVFENKKAVDVDGKMVWTLDDTSHFFYLLCHAYKHFVNSGVGVRQLCDILMMAEQCGPSIDWEYVIGCTKRFHMYVFWMNLFDIGEEYLGFRWEKSGCPRPENVKPDSEALLLDMLDGGIYGKSSVGRLHSANITMSAVKDEKGAAGEISLKSSLFPPKSYMEKQYPYVKENGLLLPAAWMQRGFRYWKKIQRLKKEGQDSLDSIAVGKQRVALLKQYGILADDQNGEK